MKFGFILLFSVVVIAAAGCVWLAVTDMPVQQRDMTVDIPVGQ